jgi:hypothetical protein
MRLFLIKRLFFIKRHLLSFENSLFLKNCLFLEYSLFLNTDYFLNWHLSRQLECHYNISISIRPNYDNICNEILSSRGSITRWWLRSCFVRSAHVETCSRLASAWEYQMYAWKYKVGCHLYFVCGIAHASPSHSSPPLLISCRKEVCANHRVV